MPKKTSNKTRRAQPKKKQGRSSSIPKEIVSKVCGVTDPFCSHAIGAQSFNRSNLRTIPYYQHYRQTYTADVNGNVSILMCPNYYYGPALGTVNNSSKISTFVNFNPTIAVFGSTPSRVRLVTAGVVVKSIAAPLVASGSVRVRTYGMNAGGYLTTLSAGVYNCIESSDTPLRLTNETAIIFQRTDVKSEQFYAPSSTTPTAAVADFNGNGWTQALISVEGGPATDPGTNVLEVEVHYHWELVFDEDDAMAKLAVPTPPRDPLVTEAAEYVQSSAASIFDHGIKAAGKYVVDNATSSIKKAITARFPPAGLLLNA